MENNGSFMGPVPVSSGSGSNKSKKYVEEKCGEFGVVIYQKDNNGNEFWYSDSGSLVHELLVTGIERWYDKDGYLIRMEIPAINSTRWYNPPCESAGPCESMRIVTDDFNGGQFVNVTMSSPNAEKYGFKVNT